MRMPTSSSTTSRPVASAMLAADSCGGNGEPSACTAPWPLTLVLPMRASRERRRMRTAASLT